MRIIVCGVETLGLTNSTKKSFFLNGATTDKQPGDVQVWFTNNYKDICPFVKYEVFANQSAYSGSLLSIA